MKMFCVYRIGYVLTNKFTVNNLHKKIQYCELILKRIDALQSKNACKLWKVCICDFKFVVWQGYHTVMRACVLVFQYFCHPRIRTNYWTCASTTSILQGLCSFNCNHFCFVCQEYYVRNDSPCGSTVWPILSASLGLLTLGRCYHTCTEWCYRS